MDKNGNPAGTLESDLQEKGGGAGAAERGGSAVATKGPRGRFTIRDIATMTGMSRSTVSLAINDSPKIKPKTKQQILDVIERVGYRPNQSARNLASRRAGTVLVIVPKLSHVFSDFYFSEALSGIMEELSAADQHMLVEAAGETFKTGGRALKLYRQHAVDGAMAIGNLNTDAYLVELSRSGCPVVLVNSSLPGVPKVLAANEEGAFRAVQHLAAHGHKRIAHIKGPESVTTAVQRTAGYMRAVRELGIVQREDYVAQGYFDEQSGYGAMAWLLSRPEPPTAVFTTNDMMALGAIEAVKEKGLRVPEDVAIFGGDDVQLARYAKPPLSTMRQDMYNLGRTACQNLFALMKGETVEDTTDIKVELVIRESCGASLKR